jgi:hypothetical protein
MVFVEVERDVEHEFAASQAERFVARWGGVGWGRRAAGGHQLHEAQRGRAAVLQVLESGVQGAPVAPVRSRPGRAGQAAPRRGGEAGPGVGFIEDFRLDIVTPPRTKIASSAVLDLGAWVMGHMARASRARNAASWDLTGMNDL